jgi:hypothetical protein
LGESEAEDGLDIADLLVKGVKGDGGWLGGINIAKLDTGDWEP